MEAGAAPLGCAIAPPEPEAVESTVAVGVAPLLPLPEADCTGALLLVWPVAEAWLEFGIAAAPDGAAEAPALLQLSEIILASLTLNLLSEPIEPVREA